MIYAIKAGTVDVSVVIRIVDSTDGTPETGVVFNTAGIDLEYRRELAASVDITEATLAALTTAHSDGGFLHIGNGYYRLDLPDAACATGATGVLIHGAVTGMVVIGCYIQLVAYDPFDTVRLGLTALPNVASGSAGAIPTTGTGANQLSVSSGLVTLAGVTHTGAVIPTVTTLTGHTPQTGDAYARIGANGAGLSAVPWNAAWDAEAQSEATDALNAYDPPTSAEMDARTLVAANYATAAALDTVDNLLDSEVADIQARLPAALVGGRMDSHVGAAAAAFDVYQAKVELFDDDGGTTDRYAVVWFKNGAPVTSGITSPLIHVYAVANGADLIASTAMTQIAATGTARYSATGAERIVDGAAYLAHVTATIDGSARESYAPVGRDS